MTISEKNNTKSVESIIIKIIECTRSGYDAGYIHGKTLKKEIHSLYDFVRINILKKEESTFFKLAHELFLPYIPEIYVKEMQGIADGAEITFDFILLVNSYDDIMSLLACSSIGVLKNTNNRTFYHARNLDYPIDYLAGKAVVINYKEAGLVSIVFPGYIGGITSTNTRGITLSSQTLPQKDNPKTSGIPSGILYRMATEKANNLEEALEILENKKRAVCNNILLSSEKENKMAVAEFYPKTTLRRYADKKGIVCTNHYITNNTKTCCLAVDLLYSAFRKLKLQIGKIKYSLYSQNIKKAEKDLKAFIEETSQNSSNRYKILEFFLNTCPKINLTNLKDIMHAVAQTGPESYTVQSIIFNPTDKEIYISNKNSTPVTGAEYVTYKY